MNQDWHGNKYKFVSVAHTIFSILLVWIYIILHFNLILSCTASARLQKKSAQHPASAWRPPSWAPRQTRQDAAAGWKDPEKAPRATWISNSEMNRNNKKQTYKRQHDNIIQNSNAHTNLYNKKKGTLECGYLITMNSYSHGALAH